MSALEAPHRSSNVRDRTALVSSVADRSASVSSRSTCRAPRSPEPRAVNGSGPAMPGSRCTRRCVVMPGQIRTRWPTSRESSAGRSIRRAAVPATGRRGEVRSAHDSIGRSARPGASTAPAEPGRSSDGGSVQHLGARSLGARGAGIRDRGHRLAAIRQVRLAALPRRCSRSSLPGVGSRTRHATRRRGARARRRPTRAADPVGRAVLRDSRIRRR